jgi:hypothetical protein
MRPAEFLAVLAARREREMRRLAAQRRRWQEPAAADSQPASA